MTKLLRKHSNVFSRLLATSLHSKEQLLYTVKNLLPSFVHFSANEAEFQNVEYQKDCWHKSAKITKKFAAVSSLTF